MFVHLGGKDMLPASVALLQDLSFLWFGDDLFLHGFGQGMALYFINEIAGFLLLLILKVDGLN